MVENMRNFHKKESLDGLVKELQNILNESLDNPILWNINQVHGNFILGL